MIHLKVRGYNTDKFSPMNLLTKWRCCLSFGLGRFIPKEEGDLSVALPIALSLYRMSHSISRELSMDIEIVVRKTR
jgi:hypothetical protein